MTIKLEKTNCVRKLMKNIVILSLIFITSIFSSSCSKKKSSNPIANSLNNSNKLNVSLNVLQSTLMISSCVLNQKINEIECREPVMIWSNHKQSKELTYPFGVYNPKTEKVEWEHGQYEWSNEKQTEVIINVFGFYNPINEKVEWKTI